MERLMGLQEGDLSDYIDLLRSITQPNFRKMIGSYRDVKLSRCPPGGRLCTGMRVDE